MRDDPNEMEAGKPHRKPPIRAQRYPQQRPEQCEVDGKRGQMRVGPGLGIAGGKRGRRDSDEIDESDRARRAAAGLNDNA